MRRLALVAASLVLLGGDASGAGGESGEGSASAPDAAESPGSKPTTGRFRAPNPEPAPGIDRETYERLIGLGYLQGYAQPPKQSGVTQLQPERVQPGLNIVVSGDSPTASIQELDGTVLHTWKYATATEIWPEFAAETVGAFWRRAHVYPNGDLLAIYEYAGLVKLDANSNLLWTHRGERNAHHDLQVLDNGLIYVLTSQHRVIPSISDRTILDEYITVHAPGGGVIREFSILDLISSSKYAHLLNRPQTKAGGFYGHVLHTNTLEVFDGRAQHVSPIFKRGNVLISILMLDTIAIADLKQGKLIWAYGRGDLSRQHQPTLLESGNILLFDNRPADGCSRVIEIEPSSKATTWSYDGCQGRAIFSATCGSNQRLANGNTLITETDNGRAIEVTSEGEIVWEYRNPARAGDDDELVASLLEVIRVDRERFPFLREAQRASKAPTEARGAGRESR